MPRLVLLIVLLHSLLLFVSAGSAAWKPIGPFGGDARSLTADPLDHARMYLGTRTGQVYMTTDGGRNWSLLEGLQAPTDWVVDYLEIHPQDHRTVYAAMWSLRDNGGGVYRSTDSGRSWELLRGIEGHSIRAFTIAPSSPNVLVVGTLDGVFRSRNAGVTWDRISPLGHPEIRNVESVAVDPRDPNVIYAGTWHLAWKTLNGGESWISIKEGMIDDSDVFSIAINPANPDTVYATACTGIYRSDSAGARWRKIQGIPSSSRRTHKLVLDPRDSNILYAGTTEGLWRTDNGGESWRRLTSHAWTINSIVLNPHDPQHFHVGMDAAGVMETRDGGVRFRSANNGFSQRQISSLVQDPADGGAFYVSVLHDGDFGGVFMLPGPSGEWRQLSAGLEGQDVLSLLVVTRPDWKLLAGTPDGIYEYTRQQPVWRKSARWQIPRYGNGIRSTIAVRDIYQRAPDEPIYAATSAGLFESNDAITWNPLFLAGETDGFYSVAVAGPAGHRFLVANSVGLTISRDGGRSWSPVALDGGRPIRVRSLASGPARPQLVLAGTEAGLFRSTNAGLTWRKAGRGLPESSISYVRLLDATPHHILVAGRAGAFFSDDEGEWYARVGTSFEWGGRRLSLTSLLLLDHSQAVVASADNGLFLYQED